MTSGCASTRRWTGGATCCSPPGWSPSWSPSRTACCPMAGARWAGPNRGGPTRSFAAAAGRVALLVGIPYGLLPYGGHPMGWTNPWVLPALFGGLAMLVVFVYVETKVAEPLFRISLFKIRAFAF